MAPRKPIVQSWPKIHPQLRDHNCYCFYKAAQRLRSIVDDELASLGVVAPQFGILSMLSGVGTMTQVELGEYMAIDKATMVRLLDGLEALGYLTREVQKQDRRSRHLALTKAGTGALKKMRELGKRAEDRFLAPLSAQEQKALAGLVQKLLQMSI